MRTRALGCAAGPYSGGSGIEKEEENRETMIHHAELWVSYCRTGTATSEPIGLLDTSADSANVIESAKICSYRGGRRLAGEGVQRHETSGARSETVWLRWFFSIMRRA